MKIYKKLLRKKSKVTPEEMENAPNIIESIPEEMVNITLISKSFFGIKYNNKVIFTCKICDQQIHPQIGANGHTTWQCPNNYKINGKKDK